MSLRQPSGDVLRGQDPDKNSDVTRVSHPELPSIERCDQGHLGRWQWSWLSPNRRVTRQPCPNPLSRPRFSSSRAPNSSRVSSFARVIENHHGLDGEDYAAQYPEYGEGCLLQCDCSAECYRDDSSHREYRSGHGRQRVLGGRGMDAPAW